MAKLTDAAARAAKPGDTVRAIPDGEVPGMDLRITPSGRKFWSLRVRHNGRQVRVHLGEYLPASKAGSTETPGSTSLASARELGRAARLLASRGQDPEHAVRPPVQDTGATVSVAVSRWMATKADNRSQPLERRRLELHVLPTLGEKPIRDVSRADLSALLHNMAFNPDPKAAKPVEANRTFTSLRGLFRWVAEQGMREDDPTALLRRPVKLEPSAKRQREGTVPLLSMEELARLWRAAPGIKSAVLGDLLRCMLLVPLRRDEWTDLAWSELRDPFTADGWTGAALQIGAERMKGRRPALVPLPPQAVALLAERKKRTGAGGHVFAIAGREKPFSGWKRAAETLRGLLPGQRTDWSAHTIRKSVATALVRDLGADELLVGRILQHSPRAMLGVTAVYQRSDRLKEQADLLTRWGAHLETVAASLAEDTASTGRVVRLRRRAAGTPARG